MDESVKRRCELGLTMCNWEEGEANKRRKKTNKESGLRCLPDAVALSCLARLSRLDHAALSLVSKTYRSLVASPELARTRCLIGSTEPSSYVCLRVFPEPTPRWFVMTPHRRRLGPIPSNPYQAPDSSSFVVVDSGIYVIGGIVNGKRTWDVSYLDCFSHTWRRVPSMKMARASPSASLVDGKIYVFGGLADYSTWAWAAEVFDPKTQTWESLMSCDDVETRKKQIQIQQSVVLEGEKNIYAVDEENQCFTIHLPRPSECTFSTSVGKIDRKRGYRTDWCAIGKLLFCRATRRAIVWCEPDELAWKRVKGLEELESLVSSSRHVVHDIGDDGLKCTLAKTWFRYDINKLCTNSAGNIVIFWISQLEDPVSLELWSAEISVERRRCQGRPQVWGKIEWSAPVFKLDPLSHSYGCKIELSMDKIAKQGKRRMAKTKDMWLHWKCINSL